MGRGQYQATTQAWLEGLIWAQPHPCTLLSPPSFLISIKGCCFVNAAVWLALLLQATWTGEGGDTWTWSRVGGG